MLINIISNICKEDVELGHGDPKIYKLFTWNIHPCVLSNIESRAIHKKRILTLSPLK